MEDVGPAGSECSIEQICQTRQRFHTLQTLPLEGGAWSLRCVLKPSKKPAFSAYVVTVVDSRSKVLGSLECQNEEIAESTALLLYGCCLSPNDGKPRRPIMVTTKSRHLLKISRHLKTAGIDLINRECGQCTCKMETTAMKACLLCGYRGEKKLFITCPSCQCAIYCSEECKERDCSRLDAYRHLDWCKEMKAYMKYETVLRHLPFTFAEATTAETFCNSQLTDFLNRHGVRRAGFWRREEPSCPHCDDTTGFGELPTEVDSYVLPWEECVLESPSDSGVPTSHFSSWEDYYKWRGFSLSSPIAVLLQYALTLYYIVSTLMPTQCGTLLTRDLTVLILGAEKEADLIPTFFELNALIPETRVRIYAIGPQLSPHVTGVTKCSGNVTATAFCGTLEAFVGRHKDVRPDVTIGFNAGLTAYTSWQAVLSRLGELRLPAFFTEYCPLSCELARRTVCASGFGSVTDPVVNPFRSPFRKICEENELAMYSNAFIYRVAFNGTSI